MINLTHMYRLFLIIVQLFCIIFIHTHLLHQRKNIENKFNVETVIFCYSNVSKMDKLDVQRETLQNSMTIAEKALSFDCFFIRLCQQSSI